MGCGCNKNKTSSKPKSKVRETLRKMWEKSETEPKPVSVKEINKP